MTKFVSGLPNKVPPKQRTLEDALTDFKIAFKRKQERMKSQRQRRIEEHENDVLRASQARDARIMGEKPNE